MESRGGMAGTGRNKRDASLNVYHKAASVAGLTGFVAFFEN